MESSYKPFKMVNTFIFEVYVLFIICQMCLEYTSGKKKIYMNKKMHWLFQLFAEVKNCFNEI